MGISQAEFDAQTKERIAKDAAAKAAFDAVTLPAETEEKIKEAGPATNQGSPTTPSLSVETDESADEDSSVVENQSDESAANTPATQIGWFRRLLNKLS